MEMEKLVSLCKRRGFIFQSSEIYGGLNGFWDYGPLGVLLKRNLKQAWWHDLVTTHNDLVAGAGTPEPYSMVGLDTSIIMHPQVWRVSGHYDLFHDYMVDCRQTKRRYRVDQLRGRWVETDDQRLFVTTMVEAPEESADVERRALAYFGLRKKHRDRLDWKSSFLTLSDVDLSDFNRVLAPEADQPGSLTEPREFNLMFETSLGALATEDSSVFLRPETAQGIFVNFKNVLDSTRLRLPFGIAQMGKSFRNEITPRNFTFRSREFEQMEIEFFCHPGTSEDWYDYWCKQRMNWYTSLGLAGDNLRLREHEGAELSHYSSATADIEYSFPFLAEGEFGELEGIAHRGDFDLRSHMEGKLDPSTSPLQVEEATDGEPRWKGSGKDLAYRDLVTGERYFPHVIEPSAGVDRAALAFLCEAYTEDSAPDSGGKMQSRTVMKLHPRLAPIKAAIFPLVKKEGMPELAKDIYSELKKHFNVFYDEKGAVGRRYRRQDEAGTPYCITVDGQTLEDGSVTFRDRDSLRQWRVKSQECVPELRRLLE